MTNSEHVHAGGARLWRRVRRLGLIVGLILLALVAGILIRWNHLFFGSNLYPVVEGQVYRSGQPSAAQLTEWHERYGLLSVLCLRGADADESWWREEVAVAAKLGLDLRAVKLDADEMAGPEDLAQVVAHIEQAPRPLLVHCMAGVERAGLGSALTLLVEGADVPTARAQFGLDYGFVGWMSGSRHPQLLDQYEAWLSEQGRLHDPEAFKAWLAVDYVADFYEADLSLVDWPEVLRVGHQGSVICEVRNTSVADIGFRSTPEKGVHLRVEFATRKGKPRWHDKRNAPLADLDLIPGESTSFRMPIPDFPRPGEYILRLALVDEDVAWFRDMGGQDLLLRFEVLPAE